MLREGAGCEAGCWERLHELRQTASNFVTILELLCSLVFVNQIHVSRLVSACSCCCNQMLITCKPCAHVMCLLTM